MSVGTDVTPPKRIAIIGAGMAGLSCATALQSAGHDVAVFDKSRGVGGRMSTRRGIADPGDVAQSTTWYCDHGAPYFTAQSAAFRDEVKRWCVAGVAAEWSPVVCLGDAGEDRSQTTAIAFARFVGTPQMTSPAAFLASSLHLTCQRTVTALHRREDKWQLEFAEQGVVDDLFDAVVLALPAPQAAPLLSSAATSALLRSEIDTISSLKTMAASVKMHATWIVMLQFTERVTVPSGATVADGSPLDRVVRNSAKPGRTGTESWVLHAKQGWSAAHIEDAPELVATHLIAAFTSMGGPAPRSWSAHRWRYSTTDPAIAVGSVWDATSNLGICGDWMNGGTVESAWQSGQQLARSAAGLASSVGVKTKAKIRAKH